MIESDAYEKSHILFEDEDCLASMREARRSLDCILSRTLSATYYNPDPGSQYAVLTKDELEKFRQSVKPSRKWVDVSSFLKSIGLSANNDILFPFSLFDEFKFFFASHPVLLDENQVANVLMEFMPLFIIEGIGDSENTLYLDSEIVDLTITNDEIGLSKSRKCNAKDELQHGNDAFNKLRKAFVDFLTRLDPLLSFEEIEDQATYAVLVCVSFWNAVSNTVPDLFDLPENKPEEEVQYRLKCRQLEAGKRQTIRCHIGVRQWGEGSYGPGVAIEIFQSLSLDLVEEPKQSDDVSSGVHSGSTHVQHVGVIPCSILQGFILDPEIRSELNFQLRNEDSGFFDAVEVLPCDVNAKNLLLNPAQGYIKFKNLTNFDKNNPSSEREGNFGEISKIPSHQLQSKTIAETILQLPSADKAKHAGQMPISFNRCMFAWGDNESGCLGLDSGLIFNTPQKIPFEPFSSFETIVSIACSPFHTLVLSSIGFVYSCGDGSNGQLGHSSLLSSNGLKHIEWFASSSNGTTTEPIIITAISAGGDHLGCHSAAIDNNGHLYTWGKATSCGHIDSLSEIDAPIQKQVRRKTGEPIIAPRIVQDFEGMSVRQVSCGGGFTLALVHIKQQQSVTANVEGVNVRVFSWGYWEGGRLGLGTPPVSIDKSYIHAGTRRKVSRFKIQPTRINSLDGVKINQISAGEAHALAIGSRGEVYAWGQNDAGQCGISRNKHELRDMAKKKKNIFDDIWKPRQVYPFGMQQTERNHSVTPCAKTISAGGIHSAVIDLDGYIWTWGGGGEGFCLGHGEVSNKDKSYLTSAQVRWRRQNKSKKDKNINLISDLLPRNPKWAQPRKVQSLSGIKAEKISLGSAHCAVVTVSGHIYSWGNKFAPAINTNIEEMPSGNDPSVYRGNSHPVQQSTSGTLAGRNIVDVSCGGRHTFALSSGEIVGSNLRTTLGLHTENWVNPFVDSSSFFDCVLIVAGRRLFCHRVVIYNRSEKFKKMLEYEDRPMETSNIVELLLPDLAYDVGLCILEFLYTDDVTLPLSPLSPITSNLLRAAEEFKLPRLASICWKILDIYRDQQETNDTVGNDYPTLSFDLECALNNKQLSDIQFFVSGTIVYAHRCILSSQSPFFKQLFEDRQHQKTEESKVDEFVTIKLPENLSCVLRMLFYVYTGRVASNLSEANRREDILCAHRYQLFNMKHLSESEIEVTPENSLALWEISNETDSHILKHRTATVIVQNLCQLKNNLSLKVILSSITRISPSSTSEIFERIIDRERESDSLCWNVDDDLLSLSIKRAMEASSSELKVFKRVKERKQQVMEYIRREQKLANNLIDSDDPNSKFPWKMTGLLLVLVCVYKNVEMIHIEGPAIMIMNVAFLGGTLVVVFTGKRLF